jgi:hypothetical protein
VLPPREYKLVCDNNEDFDEVIREWMNFRNVLQVDNASKWEPSESSSKIEWYGPKDDMMVFFQQKEHCKTINIGTNDQPAKIIIHAYVEGK